jgi:hypothetical protein
MILINDYLPIMMTGSEPNYIEHLDKLSALIEKYEDTHNIVIAGDRENFCGHIVITLPFPIFFL